LGGAAKITLFFQTTQGKRFFSLSFVVKKIFLALFFTQKVAFLIGTYHLYFLWYQDTSAINLLPLNGEQLLNGCLIRK